MKLRFQNVKQSSETHSSKDINQVSLSRADEKKSIGEEFTELAEEPKFSKKLPTGLKTHKARLQLPYFLDLDNVSKWPTMAYKINAY